MAGLIPYNRRNRGLVDRGFGAVSYTHLDVYKRQENATDTCVGANLQEVQDYLILTHHILYCNQFLINASKFDSLDPLYQEALQQAIDEAAVEIEAQLTEIDVTNRQLLVDGGMELVEFDASFIDQVLEKAKGVYESIGKAIGQDYVDSLLNALEK